MEAMTDSWSARWWFIRARLPWTKPGRMVRRARAARIRNATEPNFTGLLAHIPEARAHLANRSPRPVWPSLEDAGPPEPDLLAQVFAQLLPARPVASRLEMGWLARRRLVEHCRAAGNCLTPNPFDPPSMATMLYGIPITESVALDPDVWRLLDRDGQVIKEGTL